MKDKVYLDKEKPFFKGNLHTHTTVSDGAFSPQETAKLYKDAGYDFLALTDHDIYGKYDELNSEDFIVLPAMEKGKMAPNPSRNLGFHLSAIDDPTVKVKERYSHLDNFTEREKWEGLLTVQNKINEMREKGNIVIYNHPEWSMHTYDMLEQLDGYFALEIYNHGSEFNTSGSYGASFWDYLLRKGRKVFGIASDDAHFQWTDTVIKDHFGGWVMVQVDSLSHANIVTALKKGDYYSSTGPEIYSLSVEDGFVKVECSECKFIEFKAYPERGGIFFNKDASPLTKANLRIKKEMVYIRVECVDYKGNIGYSNPIFIKDLY
ncbi:phosphotransferase [Vallitalea longa]|uniref:Phosphotransferase n=1 Tax=Vallitalea longa TaxID=2936439 RepID=A0A9W5Y742_9FIRM|nr:PHP domain-containing protein [Vallitalea longa]GKX27715.1 phosphotransferase [Vallitalea longa]